MVIGRFLGWLLLLIAGAVLVRDALVWNDLRVIAPLSLGGFWSDLAPASLRASHQALGDHAAWLWSWLIGPLLRLWALPVFAILGLVLVVSCRRRVRRRFH